MSYVATVQFGLEMRSKSDGSGYTVYPSRGAHVHLQVGNVSVAFDDRNIFHADGDYSGIVVQVGPLTDDPVRLNGESVTVGDSPAEKLLRALAADLGYRISRDESFAGGVCDDCGCHSPELENGYCPTCAACNE